MWSQWSRAALVTVAAAACGFTVVAVVSATTSSSPKRSRALASETPTAADRAGDQRVLARAVRIVPANGNTEVAPDAPVVVAATAGRIGSVRVTSTTGVPVAGMLGSSGTRWQSTKPLDYATTYKLSVVVRGSSDTRARLTSTFRTLAPPTSVSASVFPSDGLSVGVGQPIVFRFDHYIATDAGRAAVLRHLDVTESEPVAGGWHWFSNNELHFRPKTYWPAHNEINVSWDLRGWNAGEGMSGSGAGRVRFVIGDARVSFANLATHEMNVTDNGRVVAKYPISAGNDSNPTMGGVHIVLDRSSVVRMDSSTNGVPVNSPDGYDMLVYWDVHISDSGEYVHSAPWSTDSQGRDNVSHGCINLSEANARAFFDFSRVGDVVLVGGGPRGPERGDHGVMDWDTAWEDFTPANAMLHVPAALSISR
jgi:lipoprotein-anchoring transpeptidase ErfK/SrfK